MFIHNSIIRIFSLLTRSPASLSSFTRAMSSPTVVCEKLANIYMIGICRPEKRNAVDPHTAALLSEHIEKLENDDELRVGVLYGKGHSFCAGYDLEDLSSRTDSTLSSIDAEKGLGPMGPTRRFISKPLIAAVSGYAVAGGLELALMCDIRIADESAIFGVFCRRFGVPLLDGGTVRLPRLIGLSRALDLILIGRPVKAQEALQMGLVSEVVPTGTALGHAVHIAQSLCRFPQKCMLTDRASAYHSMFDSPSMDEAFGCELVNGAKVVKEESVKGAQNFMKGAGRHGSFKLPEPQSKL